LDAPTPRGAVDALTAYLRGALQCIAQVEVLSTGTAPGLVNNLMFVAANDAPANLLPLRRVDRAPYLHLKVAMEYAVVGVTEPPLRPRFRTSITMYMYSVLDLTGRELFAYHWHPTGVSAVRTPHFHASTTPPVLLPSAGNPSTTELVLNRIHFPTHRLELDGLVRFLIIELGVGPRRADWVAVLDRIERLSNSSVDGHTWRR
jgi:hypothetical protein